MNKKGVGLTIFIISLVSFMLFSFAINSWIIHFVGETNPSSEILSEEYGLNSSVNNYETKLNSYKDLSNNIKDKFKEDEPSATDYIYLIFQSAFQIPKTIFLIMTGFVELILVSLFPTIGGSGIIAMVITFIGSTILVTMVLITIKTIRTGESER